MDGIDLDIEVDKQCALLGRDIVWLQVVKHPEVRRDAVGIFSGQMVVAKLQHKGAKSAQLFWIFERRHR